MPDLNKVFLMGRLTFDPELRRTPSGTAVTELRLATKGDRVLVTAGVPFDVPGTTNLLKVETV